MEPHLRIRTVGRWCRRRQKRQKDLHSPAHSLPALPQVLQPVVQELLSGLPEQERLRLAWCHPAGCAMRG